MHTLHIKLDGKLSLPGLNSPEIDSPVINVPIADAIGTMMELGLQAIPDRASDGNPEVIAHGSVRVPVFKIFGRQINIDENYEIDAEIWVTSTDEVAQAQSAAMAANQLEGAPKQFPNTVPIPETAPVTETATPVSETTTAPVAKVSPVTEAPDTTAKDESQGA